MKTIDSPCDKITIDEVAGQLSFRLDCTTGPASD